MRTLKAIAHPQRPKHENMAGWLDHGNWDANAFDISGFNDWLAYIKCERHKGARRHAYVGRGSRMALNGPRPARRRKLALGHSRRSPLILRATAARRFAVVRGAAQLNGFGELPTSLDDPEVTLNPRERDGRFLIYTASTRPRDGLSE